MTKITEHIVITIKHRLKLFPEILYISGFLFVIAASFLECYYLNKYQIWELHINWEKKTLPDFDSKLIPEWLSSRLNQKGKEQHGNWIRHKNEITNEFNRSEKRLDFLSSALTDFGDPLFLEARQRVTEESQKNAELDKQVKKFIIPTGKNYFWQKFGLYILLFVIYIVADWGIVSTSRKLFSAPNVMGNWSITYLLFVLTISAILLTTFTLSSIVSENKSWVGTTSFFVCPGAWIAERMELLGMTMILAIPLTRLWRLTRDKLIPSITKENLHYADGKCGVGNYINFLEFWTNLSFIFFSLVTIIGLRPAINAQITFDNIYLLPTLMAFIITSAFASRMILNGLILRERYASSIRESFQTLQDKESSKIANDPTIDFIGERWWKIPLTLLGVIGTAWTIFEWSGISKVIQSAVQ